MNPVLNKEKIDFIREEIKKIKVEKRTCKYEYKNWFKSIPVSDKPACGFTSPFDLWKSPKFKCWDDAYYAAHYGKLFITCLHIMLLKLTGRKKSHTKDDSIYNKEVQYINMWIEERISNKKSDKML